MSNLPRVLIVDDELDLAEILADFLEGAYEASIANDPLQALERLRCEHFDLVITDMHMPGADGFAVISAAAAALPQVPVIILTGSAASDPIVERALGAGAKGVITKPFASPDKVLDYLKRFVG